MSPSTPLAALELRALAVIFAVALASGQGTTARAEAADFRAAYAEALWKGATAGLFVDHALELARRAGFRVVDTLAQDAPSARPGERLAFVHRDRTILLAVVGKRPIAAGLRIVGAHIDAPHLRVRAHALGKVGDHLVLRASAYGGIKSYQWDARLLRLVGHVHERGGARRRVELGGPFVATAPPPPTGGQRPGPPRRSPGQRVFDVIVSSAPPENPGPGAPKGGADPQKCAFLEGLRARFGVTEDGLRSADLALVTAERPRDAGLDRGLIGGAGQDDRASAIPALLALLALRDTPEQTAAAYLVDREELGSSGTTGAASAFLDRVVAWLARARGEAHDRHAVRQSLAKTEALSADVTAGVNPLFPEVHELSNAPRLGAGLGITKFTGYAGKLGASEASAELVHRLTTRLRKAGIPMQPALLGKVDEGGGGTIAKDLAHKGVAVLDVGIGVLSMHSPFELASWRDLVTLTDACRAFWTRP